MSGFEESFPAIDTTNEVGPPRNEKQVTSICYVDFKTNSDIAARSTRRHDNRLDASSSRVHIVDAPTTSNRRRPGARSDPRMARATR